VKRDYCINLKLVFVHNCWPRDAKLVENLIMFTLNLQMAVNISIQQS